MFDFGKKIKTYIVTNISGREEIIKGDSALRERVLSCHIRGGILKCEKKVDYEFKTFKCNDRIVDFGSIEIGRLFKYNGKVYNLNVYVKLNDENPEHSYTVIKVYTKIKNRWTRIYERCSYMDNIESYIDESIYEIDIEYINLLVLNLLCRKQMYRKIEMLDVYTTVNKNYITNVLYEGQLVNLDTSLWINNKYEKFFNQIPDIDDLIVESVNSSNFTFRIKGCDLDIPQSSVFVNLI